MSKELIVIGGPNGAGKTTWATRHLSKLLDIHDFVNADEIAHGLSPLNPEHASLEAGKLMITRLREFAASGTSFAFETTCSGHRHVRFIESCRAAGYRVTFIFLWLSSAELAISRVARRVSAGGHNIPKDVIARRYRAGLRNMRYGFLPNSDLGFVYDNSDHSDQLIADHRAGMLLVIHDPLRWAQIEAATS